MSPETAQRLQDARPFGTRSPVPCKICGSAAKEFGCADFYRMCWGGPAPDPYFFGFSGIEVGYYRCPDCDFLFTPFFDDWSSSDFEKFVYNDQYVLVDPEYVSVRPLSDASAVHGLLGDLQSLNILDYGSGSGVFARELERLGRETVLGYDPFSNPERPRQSFDVITCFEVMEHVVRPLDTFNDILSFLKDDGVFMFSQCVHPKDIEKIRCGWWYIAPRNGHISTYSENTLRLIASILGVELWRNGGLFMMTRQSSGQVFDALRVKFAKLGAMLALTAEPATEGWHGAESSDRGAFAWTASQTVSWRRLLVAGKNMLRLHCANEIRPGFASECVFTVDGVTVPTRVDGDKIVGDVVTDKTGWVELELHQPPLVRASAHGGNDTRFLGIAAYADLN